MEDDSKEEGKAVAGADVTPELTGHAEDGGVSEDSDHGDDPTPEEMIYAMHRVIDFYREKLSDPQDYALRAEDEKAVKRMWDALEPVRPFIWTFMDSAKIRAKVAQLNPPAALFALFGAEPLGRERDLRLIALYYGMVHDGINLFQDVAPTTGVAMAFAGVASLPTQEQTGALRANLLFHSGRNQPRRYYDKLRGDSAKKLVDLLNTGPQWKAIVNTLEDMGMKCLPANADRTIARKYKQYRGGR